MAESSVPTITRNGYNRTPLTLEKTQWIREWSFPEEIKTMPNKTKTK